MSDAAQWRKRSALLHYIQVVHEGRMRWLNVSSLKWNDLVSLASKSLRKKLELWYLLGISLDSVLAAPTCSRMVRVLMRARARACVSANAPIILGWQVALLAQLVEEADFITSGSVQQVGQAGQWQKCCMPPKIEARTSDCETLLVMQWVCNSLSKFRQ